MSAHILHTKVPIHCTECDWFGSGLDADRSCPTCGGSVAEGRKSAKAMKARRPMSYGKIGEVSDETRAYIDAALRRNREDAMR